MYEFAKIESIDEGTILINMDYIMAIGMPKDDGIVVIKLRNNQNINVEKEKFNSIPQFEGWFD